MSSYVEHFNKLRKFFGGYFHQDWDYCFDWQGETPNFQGVVLTYKALQSPEGLSQIIKELEEFLELQLNDEELHRIVSREFWCDYYPPGDGLTYRQWLEVVLSILKDPNQPGKVMDFIGGTPASEIDEDWDDDSPLHPPYTSKYFDLSSYLSSYFHKNWESDYIWKDEKPSFQAVIKVDKIGANPPDIIGLPPHPIIKELEKFLSEPLTDEELREILANDFQVQFEPQSIGLTDRKWLEEILFILKDPNEKGKELEMSMDD